MSKIRKNIEFYRLPSDIESDAGVDNIADRYRNSNEIVQGYETRTYDDTDPLAKTMIIRQYAYDGAPTPFRTSTWTYNSSGKVETIVTVYDGSTTTETFVYEGSGRIASITSVKS